RLSGRGGLDTSQDGAGSAVRAEVTFDDLTFALPDLAITEGRARLRGGFALAADVSGGLPRWRVEQHGARPAGGAGELVLDREGLHASGETNARVGIGAQRYTARVRFTDEFTIDFEPIAGVERGRAELLLQNTPLAYIDRTGFWFEPGSAALLGELAGDLFFDDGIVLPDRIGLPTEDVAYLAIAQDGVSRLTTEVGPGGVRVRTAPDAPVELVLPALSADGATPTSVAVQLDATLDRTTFDLVHGELTIDGNAGLSMGAPGGLSLDVRSLRYDASDGGALTLDVEARVALLDGEPLVLTGGLTATSAGFMGTLSAGAADGALLT